MARGAPRSRTSRERSRISGLRSTRSPRLVAVAGYSFGSHVGGRAAAADPGVGFYLGVAPVVARYDYGFLAGLRGRVALISGARDEYSDPAKLEALAASLPERPWLRVLDADHFFADALDELAAACAEAIAWAEALSVAIPPERGSRADRNPKLNRAGRRATEAAVALRIGRSPYRNRDWKHV